MRWYQKLFLKNKKYYFDTFPSEKHFEKQPHSQTLVCQLPKVSYLTRTLVKELRIYLLIRLLSEFIPFENPKILL